MFYIKKSSRHLRETTEVKYRFIDEHRFKFHVGKMCLILEVSRSGYYSWKERPESERSKANKELLVKIKQVHVKNRELYGSIKLTKALKRSGVQCSKNRVARIMKENGIKSKRKRRFKATTNSKHNLPVADNLLNQHFHFKRLNQAWAADISYIPTDEGWMYVATVEDLCHRKIVGWAMDKTMTKELVIKALNQAVLRVKPPHGVIHHSDRGSQYASHDYQALLTKNGFRVSMSRKGNCYDNACMESFYSILKCELIYLTRFRTREQASVAIFEYIEVFYNRERLHSSLGYVPPEEFGLMVQMANLI